MWHNPGIRYYYVSKLKQKKKNLGEKQKKKELRLPSLCNRSICYAFFVKFFFFSLFVTSYAFLFSFMYSHWTAYSNAQSSIVLILIDTHTKKKNGYKISLLISQTCSMFSQWEYKETNETRNTNNSAFKRHWIVSKCYIPANVRSSLLLKWNVNFVKEHTQWAWANHKVFENGMAVASIIRY